MMESKTKTMTRVAMLSALAFAAVLFIRIPMVLFLEYDPKNVIITIGGFIWGPFMSLMVAVVTAFIEFLTISEDGIIGLVMNIISICTFSCTAAFIYKKDRTLRGSIIGLVSGTILLTVVMVLWNYLVTPIYMGIPRAEVVKLLVPAIMPFNLIKGGIDSAIILLIYKPIVSALRRTVLKSEAKDAPKMIVHPGVMAVAVLVIVTCVMLVLAMKGII